MTWQREPWSNSRLASYRQCARKFFFGYVQKRQKLPTSIEAYVGISLHNLLEEIYRCKIDERKVEANWDLGQWVELYKLSFFKNMPNNVRIARKNTRPEMYYRDAERMLKAYWGEFAPFDEGEIISLEEMYSINTKSGFTFRGKIDRFMKEEEWVIIDYKTGKNVPKANIFYSDSQPLFYLLLIHANYPDVPLDKLYCRWKYIRGNIDFIRRTDQDELDDIEQQLDNIINDIISIPPLEENFPTKVGSLCWWCDFRGSCPEIKGKV